jgi:hypothetical protein
MTSRLNLRKLALVSAFALVLGGSALSSSAMLTQVLQTTVNGSVTTISVAQNGVTDLVVDLPTGLTAGDVAFVPITFTNTGTGYANLTNAPVSITGGATIVPDSKKIWWTGITPDQCTETALGEALDWGGNKALPLSAPLWDNTNTISAGEAWDVCLAVKIGDSANSYGTGDTNFQAVYRTTAIYP